MTSNNGKKLINEILNHTSDIGGTPVNIYGEKGSGKTSLITSLAYKLSKSGERVILRGDDNSYVNKINPSYLNIFTYIEDGVDINVPANHMIYSSIKDLYKKLEYGKINIVYQPHSYSLSNKELIKLLRNRQPDIDITTPVDKVIFWVEFIYYLLRSKSIKKFDALIFDNASDIFKSQPSGLQWYLNLLLKDIIRDLRRRYVSLILTTNHYKDFDNRMIFPLQYKIWLNGSQPQPSLISIRQKHLKLPIGEGVIERDCLGKFKFNDFVGDMNDISGC